MDQFKPKRHKESEMSYSPKAMEAARERLKESWLKHDLGNKYEGYAAGRK